VGTAVVDGGGAATGYPDARVLRLPRTSPHLAALALPRLGSAVAGAPLDS
jgi:hypothetical protein